MGSVLAGIPVHLIIGGLLALLGGYAVFKLYMLKYSAIGVLLRMLLRSYKNGEFEDAYMLAEKPRSLSGMTSIYLPKIEKDFPEFGWQEWRFQIEKRVKLLAGELGASPAVYKTVISDYRKSSGNIYIITQTSASYIPEQEKGKEKPLKRQSVFETSLLYVQDENGASGNIHGHNCPNCGAPIRTLGLRSCNFCGTALEPVSRRVWHIESLREI